jgi:hypothetical protein
MIAPLTADAAMSAKSAAASNGRPTAASAEPLPVPAAAVAFVVEAALLWLLATGRLSALAFFVAHGAVLAALAAHVRQIAASGRNIMAAVILAIAVAATGPIGALGSLIGFLMPRRRPTPARLLRDWYQRIALSADVDQITRLCDDVSSGRHVGLDTPPPSSFVAVLERGSLANRQAALGMMARHIKTEYLPALNAALKSTEPLIRVQAAAVATKIRPELRALVDKTVGDVAAGKVRPANALALAADLEACVACGLLDAGDRIRADVTIPRLKALGASSPVLPSGASGPHEAMLLQQGRFRELRVARRIAAARGPMGRVRKRVRRESLAAGATANRAPLLEPQHAVQGGPA